MGKIYKALEKSQKKNEFQSNEDTMNETTTYEKEPVVPDEYEIPVSKNKNTGNEFPSSDIKKINQALITLTKPHSIESEQFRQLKNTILFPEKREPPRNIMVTSTSPDEGKSFVASNLAISIAQSIDEYVLLVDCDLRRPSIHLNFGFGHIEGLSEYLTQQRPLSRVLVKTFVDKLTLLPGGTIPENPSELLSSEQMRRLLHEVKLRYNDRYIIVDTPPPNMTSETNAIARQMDGIILVLREGKTRKKDVQDIIDIYGREKIIGVVKNFSTKKHRLGDAYAKYGYAG